MTGPLLRLDRAATFVVGAALLALGLLVLDWKFREVFTYHDILGTGDAQTVLDTAWWPWAFAVLGLILGLLGLTWLLAHLRRAGPSTIRLRAGDHTGLLEADLRSVATATAHRLATLAPVTGIKGTTRVYRSRVVIELRGHIDPAADAATVVDAAATCAAEVAAAFPRDDVTCRVVLNGPRSSGRGSSDRARVR